MTDARVRFVEFERGQIDMETGEFPMVLATDGEASDGDILSIEGANFTSRAPLQISHINDPTATLGTVSGFRRDLRSTPKKLRARGQIELTGEGHAADTRRDLAHMVNQGHVTGISVRWAPRKYTRRIHLPKEHFAYVKEDEPNWMKRNGFFHERWDVLEGSIVAVQADQAAIIGRAAEVEADMPHVAAFWRAMAADARENQRPDPKNFENKDDFMAACMPMSIDEGHSQEEAAAMCSSMWDERKREAETPAQPVEAKADLPILLGDLARTVNALQAEGLEIGDIQNALDEIGGPKEPTPTELRDQISALRAELDALKKGHDTAALPPAFRNVNEIFDLLDQKLAAAGKQVSAAVQAAIDKRRGKLTPNGSVREQVKTEVDSLLAQAAKREQISATDAERIKRLIENLEELVADARERSKKAPPQE